MINLHRWGSGLGAGGKNGGWGGNRPALYLSSMKPIVAVFMGWTLALGQACQGQERTNALPPAAFMEKLARAGKQAQLIDVRTPEEYALGHLAGAALINIKDEDALPRLAALDKRRPVLVYCLAGGRSRQAADYLHKQGFAEVYDLKGGALAWEREKLPLTKPAEPAQTGQTNAPTWTLADIKKAAAAHAAVLVDFYAPWCGPCKQMEPHLAAVAKEGKIKVVRINVDTHRVLAAEYAVTEIPVVLAFKQGKQVLRLEGFQNEEALRAAVR